jgi:hypothetical protein
MFGDIVARRPDDRADLEAGEISGFTVNQSFLMATNVYVAIPSLLVFGALSLRPSGNRVSNIALGIGYALTIIAGRSASGTTTSSVAPSRSRC